MTQYTVTAYTCPNCHTQQTMDQMEDNGYDTYCASCDELYTSKWSWTERTAEYVTLAVYGITRQYGGPEEGGWWYDSGDLFPETVRAFTPGDFPQIAAYRELMEKRLGTVHRIRTFIERTAPSGFPKTKPRYC